MALSCCNRFPQVRCAYSHGTSVISNMILLFLHNFATIVNRPVSSRFLHRANFSGNHTPVGKVWTEYTLPSFSDVWCFNHLGPSNNSNELCGKMLLAIPNAHLAPLINARNELVALLELLHPSEVKLQCLLKSKSHPDQARLRTHRSSTWSHADCYFREYVVYC